MITMNVRERCNAFTNPLQVVSRKTKDRILSLLITIGVLFVTLTPYLPNVITYQDKIGHMALYSLLMLYFGRKSSPVKAGITLMIIGVILEIAQHFTWYRTAEILDIAANTIGIFLGYAYIKIRGPINGGHC